MIISQTPYRVSFAGGGSDLPEYYREDFGAVLSVTIRRHLYVTVHRRFEANIRVSYSKTEIAQSVDAIGHALVREALRVTDTRGPLEVTTIGDVPAGTGLGSSSTLTVGLLHALYALQGQRVVPELLARQACEIELDRLGHPIGKQDQYAAAFGGINYVRFFADGRVAVEPVACSAATRVSLETHGLLVYLAEQRDANEILERQRAGTEEKRSCLTELRDLAQAMRALLAGPFDVEELGRLLHQGWCTKRALGFGITNARIDESYARARRAGAWGGKVLGAGGGGFLFLLAEKARHDSILSALGSPRWLPFELDSEGSRIVFDSEARARA